MICKKCGNELQKGSLFCISCGAEITTDDSENISASDQQYTEIAETEAEYYDLEPQNGEVIDSEDFLAGMNHGAELSAKKEESLIDKTEKKVGDGIESAVTEYSSTGTNLVPIDSAEDKKKKEEKKQNTKDIERISDELKQKKKIPMSYYYIASAVILVLIIGCVFLFSSTLRNKLKRAFSSDEKYFRSVEKNFTEDLVDMLSSAYDDDVMAMFDFYKSNYSINAVVDVKDEAEEFFSNLYSKDTDLDFLWIKSAKAQMDISMKETFLRAEGEMSVNKEDIIDADLIADLEQGKGYFNIPMLSKNYFAYNYNDLIDCAKLNNVIKTSAEFKEALPTKKEIKKIISKYVDIALEKITKVNVIEEANLEAGGVKNTYYKITAVLDEKTQQNIYSAVLKELAKDEQMLDIVDRLHASGRFGEKLTRNSYLDYVQAEENKVFKTHYDQLTLSLWVDSSGNVVSQELMDDNRSGWLFKYVINGGNFGFEISELSHGESRLGLIASGTVSGTSVSGKFSIFDHGNEEIFLEFADINILKLLKGNPQGKLIFNLYDITGDSIFKDIRLTTDFNISAKKSEIDFILSDSGKTIVDADLTIKKSSASGIKAPSKITEVKNNYDVVEWINNFNWKTVLKNAKSAEMTTRYYRELEKLSESEAAIRFRTAYQNIGEILEEIGRFISSYDEKGLWWFLG